MYDRTLTLLTELKNRRKGGKNRRNKRGGGRREEDPKPTKTPKPQPSKPVDKEAENTARLKSYTDEPGRKLGDRRRSRPLKFLRPLQKAVRKRRAERMMKADGVDPKTGALTGRPGKDPRSRLEKVIAKRGQTVPQYFSDAISKARKGITGSGSSGDKFSDYTN